MVGSPADKARLPLGAVVVAVDGKPVAGPADLARRIAMLEPGREIELSYYYRGEHLRTRIVLADVAVPSRGARLDAKPGPLSDDAEVAEYQRRIAELIREVETLKQRIAELEKSTKEGTKAKE
jgi:serine protease Do